MNLMLVDARNLVDPQIMTQATKILEERGISIDRALEMFIRRVVKDNDLPLTFNAETEAALNNPDVWGTFTSSEEMFDALDQIGQNS